MGWIPFSNGTEATNWVEENCGQCIKCDPEDSTGKTTCPMEFDIATGFISGEISFETCQKIGYTKLSEQKNGNFVDLKRICKERIL